MFCSRRLIEGRRCCYLLEARPGVVPPHLADEVYWSIVLCSVSIPVIMMTSSVVGVLYGAQRFDIVSTVQAPAAFFQYVLPLLIILWRQDLPAIVLGLLATRWIVGAVLFVAAFAAVTMLSQWWPAGQTASVQAQA